jgi:glycosyltransferase involved in cell wall biosynthesis
VLHLAARLNIGVLHGHGAKGGAYARLATRFTRSPARPRLCFYTPHGGSLHYAPTSLKGRVFMGLERRLEPLTNGLIFESAYSAARFAAQVGPPRASSRVIPNGVLAEEFAPVLPAPDATDLVFVGELRHLKGVDVLLDALAMINRTRRTTATIVGAGPEAAQFKAHATTLGLDAVARFPGALPARQAFKMGRLLIMPSRAESFPYIVLEAGAAGVPMIATRVGGIPEIMGNTETPLIAPGDVEALTVAILDALDGPEALRQRALTLQARIANSFTVEAMTEAILAFYAQESTSAVLKATSGRAALATE